MEIKIEHKTLRSLSKKIFMERGVCQDDAVIVVDALVEADLRGHDSHGVIRIPKWIAGLDVGAINAMAKIIRFFLIFVELQKSRSNICHSKQNAAIFTLFTPLAGGFIKCGFMHRVFIESMLIAEGGVGANIYN